MVVLVGGVNKGVLHGIQYARSLNPDRIMAVTVASDDEDRQRIERQWAEFGVPIELHTVYSPYRELTRPIMQFIDELDAQYGDDIITVVIPEFVTSWGTQWLHNGSAFALKAQIAAPAAHRRRVRAGPHARRRRRRGLSKVEEGARCTSSSWDADGSGPPSPASSSPRGHEVVVIDRRREAFRRLGSTLHRPHDDRRRVRPRRAVERRDHRAERGDGCHQR